MTHQRLYQEEYAHLRARLNERAILSRFEALTPGTIVVSKATLEISLDNRTELVLRLPADQMEVEFVQEPTVE